MGAKQLQENIIPLELPYFYGSESECFQFFKLPKILFSHPELKHLSNDCKLLYSFMLDRVTLSAQNNWKDKDGRVYIIYTNEEASQLLGKTPRSITTLMQKMDSEGGKGLIERKKRGQGKCDLIYVKNLLSLLGEIEGKTEKSGSKNNENPEIQPLNSAISSGFIVENYVENPVENFSQVQELTVQNVNSYSPRVEKFSGQDRKKLIAIKTDITNTDQKKTDSIRPTLPPSPTASFPQSPQEEQWEDGWGDDWKDTPKDERLNRVESELDDAYHQGKAYLENLLYDYRSNESKMELALYVLMNMAEQEGREDNYEEYTDSHFNFRTKKLFASALLEMLTGTYTMVRGAKISYAKVIDKLLEHIVYNEYEYRVELDSIVGCTMSAYREANQYSEISNHFGYMKSCIWSTLLEGNIRHEANFQRKFG